MSQLSQEWVAFRDKAESAIDAFWKTDVAPLLKQGVSVLEAALPGIVAAAGTAALSAASAGAAPFSMAIVTAATGAAKAVGGVAIKDTEAAIIGAMVAEAHGQAVTAPAVVVNPAPALNQ